MSLTSEASLCREKGSSQSWHEPAGTQPEDAWQGLRKEEGASWKGRPLRGAPFEGWLPSPGEHSESWQSSPTEFTSEWQGPHAQGEPFAIWRPQEHAEGRHDQLGGREEEQALCGKTAEGFK